MRFPPGYNKYGRPYFKILDKRCESGDTCTVDRRGSECAPKINGKIGMKGNIGTELEYIQVIASTETDEPRVYDIEYYFPRQFLKEDSPLGKALIAKYGKFCDDDPMCYVRPEGGNADLVGGGVMTFKKGDVFLQVSCVPDVYNMKTTNDCVLRVRDGSILDQDRVKQNEASMKKAQQNQAPAPTF